MDDALRAAEDQVKYLRAVLDASPGLIFAKDRDGRFTAVNRALADIYATTPEQLIGRSDADFSTDSEMVDVYLAADREVIDTGRPLVIPEERFTNPATGEVRWLHTRKVRLLPPGGGPPQVMGLCIDITDRKRAQDALEGSERQLAEAQHLARLGGWEYDHRTGLGSWSREGYRIFGFDPAGRPVTFARFLAVVHPGDRDRVAGSHEEAIARGVPMDLDYRILRPDGELRYISSTVHGEHDGEGRPARTFGYVQDVTERMQVELELRRSKQQLSQTQSMARLWSWDHNFAAAAGTLSDEGHAILGTDPRAPLSTADFVERVHPDDRAEVERMTARAIASGERCQGGFRIRGRAGEYRHLWSSMQVEYVGGAPARMFGHMQDITERTRSEVELRRSQHQLAQAQRLAGLASWDHDFATGTGTWSEEGYRIFGIDPATAPVSPEAFFARVHPDDVPLLVETNSRAAVLGQALHVAFRILTPEGGERYVTSSVQAEFDPAGRPVRLMGYVLDVTPQKLVELDLRRAMEAAEAANQAKSEFLSSMSHELRTPLNSVIGFSNVLAQNRGGRMDDRDLKFLERIHANGKHLLGLINAILDLSKIESGKMEVELRPVALDEMVAATLAELAGAVRDRKVELRAVLPSRLATLVTDPLKLKQVLINLVGNAVKFTERGQVTVTVEADPHTGRPLRLRVSDTGVGIAAERLSAVFQPFEQAESGTARRYGGTGLGLTISRSLCELMGYELEAESEPGVGSTFSVTLGAPAANPAERGAAPPAPPDAWPAGEAGELARLRPSTSPLPAAAVQG